MLELKNFEVRMEKNYNLGLKRMDTCHAYLCMVILIIVLCHSVNTTSESVLVSRMLNHFE